jgi:membrane fusion protein, multidrug efflux system
MRRRRTTLILLLLLLLAGGLGFAYWHPWPPPGGTAATQTAGGRGGRDQAGPVPVVVAAAQTQDVPVYLEGLGTVQAFNTVAVRAMVDGPLVEVLFREGQDVKPGDVLARIDPRPYQAALDQAMAKKRQDEANLANARADVVRYAKLAATAYASAQQLDTARAQVAQLDAQVAGDQASIDSARTQLSYTTIAAPIDGRTGLRQVDQGNIVHPSDATPITVLTQLKPISVVFTLPQQVLPAVSAAMAGGMPEVLATEQVERGAETSRPAKVLDRGQLAVLDNQVDPQTGTIKLKATFPNSDLRLWPGAFVNVRLLVRTDRDAVTVPAAAVQRGPTGPYLYVVDDGNKAERRALKLGYQDEQLSVVQSGVKPGERVVTDGAQRLTDGKEVAVAGADGNAPAEAFAGQNGGGQHQRRGGRRGS